MEKILQTYPSSHPTSTSLTTNQTTQMNLHSNQHSKPPKQSPFSRFYIATKSNSHPYIRPLEHQPSKQISNMHTHKPLFNKYSRHSLSSSSSQHTTDTSTHWATRKGNNTSSKLRRYTSPSSVQTSTAINPKRVIASLGDSSSSFKHSSSNIKRTPSFAQHLTGSGLSTDPRLIRNNSFGSRNKEKQLKVAKPGQLKNIPTIESGLYEDLLEFFKIQTGDSAEEDCDDEGAAVMEGDEDYSPANIYGFESYIIDTLDGELDDAFADLGF